MNEERAKRKLTAIFSADVAGYSRLMGDDEVGTVQLLKEYREIMNQFIQQHRGRVVDSPGDNLLAEFSSVVDATECAVKVQEKLNLLNSVLRVWPMEEVSVCRAVSLIRSRAKCL
jgi:adenylate cyclase